jgi:hypothetical protein
MFRNVFSINGTALSVRREEVIIRTDHANLRYMQESPSDKVNRWKLAYQHFDATIEHLNSSFNRKADGLSLD